MKLEKLKTITLTVLVILSLVLTYFLWTFQPNYEQLHNLETVEKVTLAEERPLNEVFVPIQVFYHDNGAHKGLYKAKHFTPLYELLLEASFENFETHTLNNQLNNVTNDGKSIDFIYPDGLSMEVFHQLLDFNQEKPALSNVERIVLFEKASGNRMKTFAWFISNDNNSYIEAEIKNQTFQGYADLYEQQKEHYLELEKLNVGSNRYPIFFPSEEIVANKYQAYPVPISEIDLTSALFPDPSLVRESYAEHDIRSYTDGNRELKLYLQSQYLTFINPTRRGDRTNLNEESHVLQAHHFVNSHGGFIEPFTFMSVTKRSENRTQVEFRMLFEGYPAFDSRIAQLKVIWQQQEVYEYERSTETISESVIYTEPEQVTLLTADELLTSVKQSFFIDENEIEKVTLGYTVSTYDDYIVFTPNWYIFYNGRWEVILKENEPIKGGNARGLEPNKNNLYHHVFRA